MAAINFPPNDVDPNPPQNGDTYSPPGLDTVYIYQDGVWTGGVSAPNQFLPLTGGNLTGDVTLNTDKIILQTSGNAEFAGDVEIDGNLKLGTIADVEQAIIAATGGTIDSISDGVSTLNFNVDNDLVANCSFYPAASNLYDLGSPTFKWKTINSVTINNSDNINISGDVNVGGTLPGTPNIRLSSEGVGTFETVNADAATIAGPLTVTNGDIQSGGNITIESTTAGNIQLKPTSDGSVLIGDDVPTTVNVKIKADGSISATGAVGVPGDVPNFATGGMEYGGGRLQLSRPLTNGTDAEEVVSVYNGSSTTSVASINNDGSITLSQGTITPSQISSAQTFTLPNKTGTIALTSDITGSGVTFKGTTDVTAAAPDPVQAGDVYVNTVAGDAEASWTGIDGDAVAQNQLVFYVADTGSGSPGWVLGGITDESEYVTLGTDQTITGEKTFTSVIVGSTLNAAPTEAITLGTNNETLVLNDGTNTATFSTADLTDSQVYQLPDKDGTIALLSDTSGSVPVSVDPPANPDDGDLWWNSDNGQLYLYYNDGASAQWVDASPDKSDNLWERNNNVITPLVSTDILSVEDLQADDIDAGTIKGAFLTDGVTTKSMGAVLAGGGGEGGDTIYNGAAAWGNVAADGTLNSGLNASVTVNAPGSYTVTFNNAMPNANYSAVVSSAANGASKAIVLSQTAASFVVLTQAAGSGSQAAGDFNFAVFALNALPPEGTTGTDAFCRFQQDGTLLSGGYNIATVTRTGTGKYDVVFTTPMPTTNYVVNASVWTDSTTASVGSNNVGVYNIATTGFSCTGFDASGTAIDRAIAISVNATNAQLPNTVTQEQIEAAINNPGVSAYGQVAADGTLNGNLNCTVSTTIKPDGSVVAAATGVRYVTFNTPMPNNQYSVPTSNAGLAGGGNWDVSVGDKLAQGFTVWVKAGNGDAANQGFDFAVFATNAPPPKGGTGTDAWGSFDQNGVMAQSYNSTVSRVGVGLYDVVFNTPMPDDTYSINCTSSFGASAWSLKTTAGFRITTYNTATGAGGDFSGADFQVNATNANLPATITQEQIDALLNGAGATGAGASAWGDILADGSIRGGLNIASVVRTPGGGSAGDWTVTFTNPMPNADYSVTTGGELNNQSTGFKTPTGFRIQTTDNSDVLADSIFYFSVFAINATPPSGTTGLDAWVNFDGTGATGTNMTIRASYNVSSVYKNSDGNFTVNYINAFPSKNYAVWGSAAMTAGGETANRIVAPVNENAYSLTNCQIRVDDPPSGDLENAAVINFAAAATNANLPATVTQEQIEAAINNPGLSAWGDVAADGTLEDGLNTASITKTNNGKYDVVFTTPMPSADYAVTISGGRTSGSGDSALGTIDNKTATGFSVTTFNSSGSVSDSNYSYIVAATNAAPPRGGTGTDAWGFILANQYVTSGEFNCTTAQNGTSIDVTFNTPMPNANYAVSFGGASYAAIVAGTQTANGFTFNRLDGSGGVNNTLAISFSVNATNANLPVTITTDQIAALIENPVLNAWAQVDVLGIANGATGTLEASFNIASCTKDSTGTYSFVFNDAMPSANYSVVVSADTTSAQVQAGQTANGFSVRTRSNSGSITDAGTLYVQIAGTARNGTLGGGADAWGSIAQNGDLEGTFNVDDVVFNSAGNYTVSFNNAMPNANYSVVATPTTGGTRYIGVNNKTANGFDVVSFNDSNQATSSPFSFAVFATDGNSGGFLVKQGDGANAVLSPVNSQAKLSASNLTKFKTTLYNAVAASTDHGTLKGAILEAINHL